MTYAPPRPIRGGSARQFSSDSRNCAIGMGRLYLGLAGERLDHMELLGTSLTPMIV